MPKEIHSAGSPNSVLQRIEPNSVGQQQTTPHKAPPKVFARPPNMPTGQAPKAAGSSLVRSLSASFSTMRMAVPGETKPNASLEARGASPPLAAPTAAPEAGKKETESVKKQVNHLQLVDWQEATVEQKMTALAELSGGLRLSLRSGDVQLTQSVMQLMQTIDGPKPAHLEALFAQGSDGTPGLHAAVQQAHVGAVQTYLKVVADLQLGDKKQVFMLLSAADENDQSAMVTAFKKGDLKLAQVMCEGFAACEPDPRDALSVLGSILNQADDLSLSKEAKGLLHETISKQKKRPVVQAFAAIGDRQFSDTNQTARSPEKAKSEYQTLISEEVAAKEEKFKSKPKNKGKEPMLPNGNMATAHAEVGAIQQAFEAGLTQGAEMKLQVTGLPVCGHCTGDIAKMAAAAGLKSLTVNEESTGLTRYWEPGMRSLKLRAE
jgi:hypothetical protein